MLGTLIPPEIIIHWYMSLSLIFDYGNIDSDDIDGDGIDSSDGNGGSIEGGDRCLIMVYIQPI